MNHDAYSDAYIWSVLTTYKTFAMVGASANVVRPSYFAMKYLLGKGYRIIPVNPGQAGREILGMMCYSSLADIPEPVEVVDIFRNSEAALQISKDAIALEDKLGLKVIWMQLGVRNDEAAALAEEAGFKVVMNRCPKIEFGRLSGEIAWAGVNARTISARKPLMGAKGFQNLTLKPRD
ncbi:MAG: CoA-binding protein [Chitinophagales bacterium]|nr:CoA-binding protein [Hyphomicrobiales bacterium]